MLGRLVSGSQPSCMRARVRQRHLPLALAVRGRHIATIDPLPLVTRASCHPLLLMASSLTRVAGKIVRVQHGNQVLKVGLPRPCGFARKGSRVRDVLLHNLCRFPL